MADADLSKLSYMKLKKALISLGIPQAEVLAFLLSCIGKACLGE
jgi:hypothetical protein